MLCCILRLHPADAASHTRQAQRAPQHDRIFDGFFSTKPDGMGIGLSVCQSIVASHGGRIDASNHPEGGAVLRFSLPLNPEGQ